MADLKKSMPPNEQIALYEPMPLMKMERKYPKIAISWKTIGLTPLISCTLRRLELNLYYYSIENFNRQLQLPRQNRIPTDESLLKMLSAMMDITRNGPAVARIGARSIHSLKFILPTEYLNSTTASSVKGKLHARKAVALDMP